MYSNQLKALEKSNRYRQRTLYSEVLVDLASNDYLGLSCNTELFENAYKQVKKHKCHGPKASMLVNGYHLIHQKFEKALCQRNRFEDGIVVGSGFLANLSLIESLVRKGDILFIDEQYHASGVIATKLCGGSVEVFAHNCAQDLQNLIENSLHNKTPRRIIIAIEGIYSMSGNIASREIFDVAKRYNALLIVDEAHSSGVIGSQLLGVFDYYNIVPDTNHIKMGTLGKAYGSYGAYILASREIVEFLINRAKAIIYTTAPSIFDIALGYESLCYIQKNAQSLQKSIAQRQKVCYEYFGVKANGLVVAIEIADNTKAVHIANALYENGFLVGCIRPPTVQKAIIRLIPKVDVSIEKLKQACELICKYKEF